MTKCTDSNLFCPLLTWIAPLLDSHAKCESLVPALTRWKGNYTSHTAQTASAAQSTSPSSNTHSAFNHSARSGKVLRSWTEREEEEEEKRGSCEELWRTFIVHHKGGTLLPWTWTETKDAMICLQKWPQGQRIHQFSCPWHSLKKMIDLKRQSEDIMQFIAVWVNKTHKKSIMKHEMRIIYG